MGKTFDNPLENYRRQCAEAAAMRREMERQESTPEGQARLEKERLEAECGRLQRQLGAQAMIEAQKLQAENPTLRTETALLMATRGQL
jgi:hypothetical protein